MPSRSKSPKPAAPVDAPKKIGVEVVRSRLHDAARASGERLAPEVVTPTITRQAAAKVAKAPTTATKAPTKTAKRATTKTPAKTARKRRA